MQPENPQPTPPQTPPSDPGQSTGPVQTPAPQNPTPAPTPNQGLQNIENPLSAMQEGEQVICDIHRHPAGLLGTYVMAGLILFLGAVGAFVLLPMYAPDTIRSQAVGWGIIGFMFLAFFVVTFSYISIKVYNGNRWVVTDDSITQLQQVSLFSTQSSQLSLHNLEDITVEQRGLFQTAFNFGTLRAETAGERSKFAFPYCPNPNHCAREILMAREKFMGGGSFQGKAGHNQDPGVNINTNG
jgi:hypothetical protein